MANGVTELLDELYTLISDARSIPLPVERCVVDRGRALDLLDEIKAQLPAEITEAQRLVKARSDFIANAKKEADNMRRAAEEHARRLMEEQTIVRAAKARGNEILTAAENRAAALRKAANDYADDAMRRTESAIAEALEEVRQSRAKFQAAAEADAQNQENF
jgi:cell division septum initiation protein DivIVA